MKLRFHPSADRSLDEIWQHTVEQWGSAQAEQYIRGLFEALEQARAHRYQWRPVRAQGFAGVYCLRYRHHLVFFRELKDGMLGVLSILHEKMDLPNRLKDDLE
jgi:toxin ParE1/3/4